MFRRRMSRLLAALALLLGTAVVAVVPGTPAQAQSFVECIEFRLWNGHRIVHCWVVDLPDLKWPWPDDCPPCNVMIDFGLEAVLPVDVVSEIGRGFSDGLTDGLAARYATDPQRAAQWRAKELAAYAGAAGKLGQAKVSFAGVTPVAEGPSPQPNLNLVAEYGNQTTLGLDLLRAGDRKGALAAFDHAAAAYDAAMLG